MLSVNCGCNAEKLMECLTTFFFSFFAETKSGCGNQGNHEKEFGQISESPRKRNQNFKGKTTKHFVDPKSNFALF